MRSDTFDMIGDGESSSAPAYCDLSNYGLDSSGGGSGQGSVARLLEESGALTLEGSWAKVFFVSAVVGIFL
jgi:hypothetical protein